MWVRVVAYVFCSWAMAPRPPVASNQTELRPISISIRLSVAPATMSAKAGASAGRRRVRASSPVRVDPWTCICIFAACARLGDLPLILRGVGSDSGGTVYSTPGRDARCFSVGCSTHVLPAAPMGAHSRPHRRLGCVSGTDCGSMVRRFRRLRARTSSFKTR